MIGDGINDSPILSAADVAISFTSGANLAQQSSDFLILNASLSNLIPMFKLAHITQRVIQQNIIWAIGYNLLAIPAAAWGYVPPWAAAIGMSASSLLVVANAMRINKKSLTHKPRQGHI